MWSEHIAGKTHHLVRLWQLAASTLLITILSSMSLQAELRADQLPADQLLRLAYDSAASGRKREFFVYLPVGYESSSETRWPVMLFLHGNGQRGEGLDDLDYVLRHGPLMEAWLQKRALPFIIISPQLPLFGEIEAIEDRKIHPLPARQDVGIPERNNGFPSDMPIQRGNSGEPTPGSHQACDLVYALTQLPPGWHLIDDELILMLDMVLAQFHADPSRVYLTGISLGGFGTFHLAAKYPERWAAIATIAGAGTPTQAQKIADARIPLWMFGGGKDRVTNPYCLYETAQALQAANLPVLRFTVHEDMDHDAWKRVYEGNDLLDWFLRYNNLQRPLPEKSAD